MCFRLSDRPRSYNTGNPVLDTVLQKLEPFDLTGRVRDINQYGDASGGFSVVSRANLRKNNGSTIGVAVKRVPTHLRKSVAFAKCFAKELHVASKVGHENIIKFEGFIIEGDYPSLVTPWADGGILNDYLQKHPGCVLAPIASGIANGLAYLHERDIIHADLKGSNVLMTTSGIPMLADFGLSRTPIYTDMQLKTSSYGTPKGTFNWMAYELVAVNESTEDIVKDSVCTEASDMWAFGMVLYEMISGDIPYKLPPLRALQAIQRKKLPKRPPLDTAEKEGLWAICVACWKFEPAERLGVVEAVEKVGDLRDRTGVINVVAVLRQAFSICFDQNRPSQYAGRNKGASAARLLLVSLNRERV